MTSFSRFAVALLLVSSLLASSVASLAQTPTQTQESQDKKETSTQKSQDKKDTSTQTQEAKDLNQAAAKVLPAIPAKSPNAKPLSTNEDPNMIGKRNINKGIIAKM